MTKEEYFESLIVVATAIIREHGAAEASWIASRADELTRELIIKAEKYGAETSGSNSESLP